MNRLIQDRPNILIIMSDDHAAYALGCMGNGIVRTPNLDRLAAEGTFFKNNFCQAPICTPSRQCIFTSKLPHYIGVPYLESPLPDGEYTLAHHLRGMGYDTTTFGKMHFNSSLHHGLRLHIDLPDYDVWLKSKVRKKIPKDMKVQLPWRPFIDSPRVWLNAETLPVGFYDEDMDGTYFADRAAEYLSTVNDRPFAAWVSFYEPHSPYRFPIEYNGLYKKEDMPEFEMGADDGEEVPEIFSNLTSEEKKGIAAAYFTSVTFLDKNIGKVLDALDRYGLSDNTLVIYLPDHGYHIGQHGRFEKHCLFDESVRVPLIMRWPGSIPAGKAITALSQSMDLMPTICDLLIASEPYGIHGKSLMPLISGNQEKIHDYVFSEYYHTNSAMVRTTEWKFIYSSGDREDWYHPVRKKRGRVHKLYHLAEDPGELHNLAGRQEYGHIEKELTDVMRACFRESCIEGLKIPDGMEPEDELDFHFRRNMVP